MEAPGLNPESRIENRSCSLHREWPSILRRYPRRPEDRILSGSARQPHSASGPGCRENGPESLLLHWSLLRRGSGWRRRARRGRGQFRGGARSFPAAPPGQRLSGRGLRLRPGRCFRGPAPPSRGTRVLGHRGVRSSRLRQEERRRTASGARLQGHQSPGDGARGARRMAPDLFLLGSDQPRPLPEDRLLRELGRRTLLFSRGASRGRRRPPCLPRLPGGGILEGSLAFERDMRGLTAFAAILLLLPNERPAGGSSGRVLVFSKTAGFRHDSIPDAVAAIRDLGRTQGFAVDATEDSSVFDDAALAAYSAVVFLCTKGDVLNEAQQAAFQRYIEAGGG